MGKKPAGAILKDTPAGFNIPEYRIFCVFLPLLLPDLILQPVPDHREGRGTDI